MEKVDARVDSDVLEEDAESPREMLRRVEEEEGERVSASSAGRGSGRELSSAPEP